MKRIINRKTGSYLTLAEARHLSRKLGGIEHRAVCGYPTEELAKNANLNAIIETYKNYIFAYTETDYVPFEGYKALVIAFKSLPENFEQNFPNYVILG